MLLGVIPVQELFEVRDTKDELLVELAKVEELNKSYPIGNGSLHVLKGIDLKIDEGELVAIMGSSGSGKSTLLKIIAGLIPSNSRTFSEEFGSSVSYLGHKNGFVEEITLRENFNILGLSMNKKLFDEFGLNKFKNQKFFNLSYGEKRKAALLLSLIHI